ncbi:hypothetical protein [Microcoleus sp.]
MENGRWPFDSAQEPLQEEGRRKEKTIPNARCPMPNAQCPISYS